MSLTQRTLVSVSSLSLAVLLGTSPRAAAENSCISFQQPRQGHADRRQPGSGSVPTRRPFRWWKDPDIAAKLKLTEGQRTQIDRQFESWLPDQRKLWLAVEKLSEDLDVLLQATVVDEASAAATMERLETAKYQMSRNRSQLLLRIYLILTREQRAILKTLSVPQLTSGRERLKQEPR